MDKRMGGKASALLLVFLAGCLPTQPFLDTRERAGEAAPQACQETLPDLVAPLPEKQDSPPRPAGPTAWGLAGLRGYPYGERTGPNGAEYNQLFALDLDLNLWLWQERRLYLLAESSFWGQKPGPGITNPSQGSFDFSKREFDYDLGAAWNFYDLLEARVFAYSFNNLNRGNSATRPSGFNDGVGVEGRYYLPSGSYPLLGTPDFDIARATFVSAGYFPTKDVVDTTGLLFKPGPFARAYLAWDLYKEKCYLFGDVQVIGKRDFTLKLFESDTGLAVRPFAALPRLEFRAGLEEVWDLQSGDVQTSAYGSCRFIF